MDHSIDHFSVMTLNLRFGLAEDGPNAWKHRKKLIPGLFRAYPDIFFHNTFDDAPCGTHHGFSGKPGKDCIDWVLHTDGITPLDAMVIRDHVEGAYYSDHFPVVVSFSFPL